MASAGPGAIAFRHPLLRATAFNAATGEQQRAAHTALAHTARDPRRRAWHLAHAAVHADEEVAGALEEAAHDARARGGHAEAAARSAAPPSCPPTPPLRGGGPWRPRRTPRSSARVRPRSASWTWPTP